MSRCPEHCDIWFGGECDCVKEPLSDRQTACLARLPDKGWHWVKRDKDGYERPVWIDKTGCGHRNDHEGTIIRAESSLSGSHGNIGITELWLEENTILGPIEPFKHPTPPNYGIF